MAKRLGMDQLILHFQQKKIIHLSIQAGTKLNVEYLNYLENILHNNGQLCSITLTSPFPKLPMLSIVTEKLKYFPNITGLYLRYINLNSDQKEAVIASVLSNPNLYYLFLENIGLNDSDVKKIGAHLKENPGKLAIFSLKGNGISDVGSKALSEALSVNSTLTKIGLQANKIGDEGLVDISNILSQKSHLKTLDLSDNHITAKGISSLAHGLSRNSTMTELDLSKNPFGIAGLKSLSEQMHGNNFMQIIKINECGINFQGLPYIFNLLNSCSALTQLDFDINPLGPKGAMFISEYVNQNSEINFITMISTDFNLNGAKVLLDTFSKNPKLETLSLKDNKIPEDIDSSLKKFLEVGASNLLGLDLSKNPVGNKAGKVIVEYLLNNPRLQYLILENVGLDDKIATDIATVIRKNNTLKHLDLSKNLFSDKGVADITGALLDNLTIIYANISFNETGMKSARAIADVIKVNTVLQKFYFLGHKGETQECLGIIKDALKYHASQYHDKLDTDFSDEIGPLGMDNL